MEKNYAICASYTTVNELIKLLLDMPSEAIVTCCGVAEFYINNNFDNGFVTIDTEKLTDEVYNCI